MTPEASRCQPVRRALTVGVLATLTFVSTMGLTGCAAMLPPDPGTPQAEVAARMGTTQSVIARIEGGSSTPSLRSVQRYAQAIGFRAVVRLEPLPGN